MKSHIQVFLIIIALLGILMLIFWLGNSPGLPGAPGRVQ